MKWLAFLLAIVLVAGCIGQVTEVPPALEEGEEAPPEALKETAPTPVTLGISVTDAPTTVIASSRFPVTWEITSPEAKSIQKTVIYYGRTSHAGDVTTAITPSTLGYDKVTPARKGTAPSTFTDQVLAGDNPGKFYFRAYALIDELNYWSDEYVIEVVPKPLINITDYPESVGTSSTFQIKWDVKHGYPGKIDKTYLMWGPFSERYTSFSPEKTGSTPQSFAATLTAPAAPQTLYFLITAVVDGKEYNTTEMTITVS